MMERGPRATRGQLLSWALFDFANTAFYVVILTVGYPLYFRDVVVGSEGRGDALWGSAFSISMFIVALLSPVLGAAADHGGGKKRYLAFFTLLCVAATAGLFFVDGGRVLPAMVLLVLANVGFEAGLVFYDAFLPEIAHPGEYGKVSGYGFAVGYAGSLVTLLAMFPLYAGGFEAGNLLNVRYSFLLAALFFLLFAAPLFFFLPERAERRPLGFSVVSTGFRRVASTFAEFGRYRQVARFLLAYFVYVDAINTIIIFSSIYASQTLHLALTEILLFFLMIQTLAIVGSLLFGRIADRIGHKRTLELVLALWISVVCIAYFITEKWLFFGVGALAGIALGSSQSTSRSLMSALTPAEKKTEFFGFYSFFGKASAILGPLVFGIISSYINQRIAILSVGMFLVAGMILLQRVDVDKPVQPG